jgi:Fe-S-cluster-containing hydrogenase component 2
LIFEMPSCGGCRTCEIACSFKHTGKFAPSASSLKILDRKDGVGFDVMIIEEDGEMGIACNGCKGEEIPLCAEYCHLPDDLLKYLLEFIKKKEQKENRHSK